jgi:hypothetical protein
MSKELLKRALDELNGTTDIFFLSDEEKLIAIIRAIEKAHGIGEKS